MVMEKRIVSYFSFCAIPAVATPRAVWRDGQGCETVIVLSLQKSRNMLRTCSHCMSTGLTFIGRSFLKLFAPLMSVVQGVCYQCHLIACSAGQAGQPGEEYAVIEALPLFSTTWRSLKVIVI
jgi:hypothetical protein